MKKCCDFSNFKLKKRSKGKGWSIEIYATPAPPIPLCLLTPKLIEAFPFFLFSAHFHGNSNRQNDIKLFFLLLTTPLVLICCFAPYPLFIYKLRCVVIYMRVSCDMMMMLSCLGSREERREEEERERKRSGEEKPIETHSTYQKFPLSVSLSVNSRIPHTDTHTHTRLYCFLHLFIC